MVCINNTDVKSAAKLHVNIVKRVFLNFQSHNFVNSKEKTTLQVLHNNSINQINDITSSEIVFENQQCIKPEESGVLRTSQGWT